MELNDLNTLFANQSYLKGYQPTAEDFELSKKLARPEFDCHPHLRRWYDHIQSFKSEDKSSNQLATEMASTNDVDNLPLSMLSLLEQKGEFDSVRLALELNLAHQKVIGAIKSLQANEDLISTKDNVIHQYELTNEGREVVDQGSQEFRVFEAIGSDGVVESEIMKKPFAQIGVGKALANKWITRDKKANPPRLARTVETAEDLVRSQLTLVRDGKAESLSKSERDLLKKRKLISETVTKGVIVGKGQAFKTTLEKPEVDLTADLLASGAWKEKSFKKYNFEALGVLPSCGHLHPLLKVRSEFRDIFFQMGFSEMPTNRYIESSFWNFDALFQPQQHPARDAHDTFFISDPSISTEFPKEYLERVKQVHSKGGYGSIGYEYDWKVEEAQKNVLRTHTTAVSARQLYLLAQNGFRPSKMFSIDRVFRNETLDATHLAEFHQVEGVVAERNLSLAHVIGLFTEFFRKCGIENLRFKHTYNPYTEPSMEIYAFHDGLNKWVEIGNSGLFRPEMLLPMGLPEDVNVAGFGLSLERPTMIRYGISNIRELFGHKIDLNMVYKNPICRLDKKDH
ncbi:Phenylalanine--tRNA ligase [Aphelenchoides besseyi]|nr:Phenylalanine--tRNA ligase [Aphelenchoides besseyi]KAI6210454.1 Phenylalanine--tRNA ligase [Aphelenchoides besseyi]